ncbi:MAG: hypothetical protein C4278_01940 [Patescibacteria group bacterium]|mgnify:CR=1 FL=1
MLKFDKKRSLFKLIKNSVNCKFFQSIYFIDEKGKSKDILKKGELSCAFYVGVILRILKLVDSVHTTVEGTIKDMLENGWQETDKLVKGAVIVWEKRNGHYHIGFYLGNKKAVSNSSQKRKPIIHSLNYQNRKIEKIYIHPEIF